VFDPLFLLCCGLYAANRWWIKPHCHIEFFHSWFNDCLLIPCALPPLLLVHREMGLRPRWAMPTVGEIAAHWAGWSVLFEVIGPHIMRTVGDPWDVVAYAGGAVVAAGVWRFPASPARGFDLLAPHYRWMERFLAGSKLQRCRTAFLHSIPAPQCALLLGEGNGRFLVPFRRAFPAAKCVCMDASAGMLAQARQSLEAAGLPIDNIEFVQADVLEGTKLLRIPDCGLRISQPRNEFDLLVTNFVLDCFQPEQLAGVVESLAYTVKPGGIWLVADFCEPASGFRKWRARWILGGMYLFFGWATALPAARLTPPDEMLTKHGFVLRERRVFEWGLLHSDLWQQVGG
jgi:ubiquinone/menaquinone biosynthesis C-methylase UbiE